MAKLLALDQGTTSTRALVLDERLRVLASAQRELPQHFPAPGLVEHDPLEIWAQARELAAAAIARAGLAPSAIDAVGLTNQRETVVLWDRRTGLPLHRAIVWQDRRTAEQCHALRAADGVEALVRERSGLLIDPYFSASKLAWLLEHCPGARERAARGELAFGTIDSWLMWQLSGRREHLIEFTNAARTMLLDLATGDWDEDLLALWSIPRAVLPRVVDSTGPHFAIRGLDGIHAPLAGVAGDQQAALFGLQCFSAGDAKCTYGTGCFILVNTGDTRPKPAAGLLVTPAWRIAGRTTWALEGSVFMGGALVQWLRDALGLIDSAEAIEALAESVPDSGGVTLVPAFTGLGAPHWDADARGLIIGLTRGTNKGHLARAALEGIALQVADVLAAIGEGLPAPPTSLRVDGGAARNDLLMSIQAAVLELELERPAILESTAIGAGALAGLGAGVWPEPATLRAHWAPERRFAAQSPKLDVTDLRRRWRAAIGRAGGWTRESA